MASYEWLKATLLQVKPQQERTNEEVEFINNHLTRQKDIIRTPEQAKRDFIDSCQWSWNTEDCLNLMKEGLVSYDIFNSIIQETWGITNKFFSIFNSKASLQSLIGDRNIIVLKIQNKCIAIEPNEKNNEDNDKKIEDFIENDITHCSFLIHGTGEYASLIESSKYFRSTNDSCYVILSNIPNYGALATNNGIEQRVKKYEHIVKTIAEKCEIIDNITSISLGNLMGLLISNIITDELNKKVNYFEFNRIAKKQPFCQSVDDLKLALSNKQNKELMQAFNIRYSDDCCNNCFHSNNDADQLVEFIKNKYKKADVCNNGIQVVNLHNNEEDVKDDTSEQVRRYTEQCSVQVQDRVPNRNHSIDNVEINEIININNQTNNKNSNDKKLNNLDNINEEENNRKNSII